MEYLLEYLLVSMIILAIIVSMKSIKMEGLILVEIVLVILIPKSKMEDWYTKFLLLAKDYKDSDGGPLKYSWFYFADGYKKEVIEKISELCRMGFGEIELQLHHKNDTQDSFRKKIREAKKPKKKTWKNSRNSLKR